MTDRADLVIGVLLPDVLGTYSDAGNALVLAKRAQWLGIDAEVLPLLADDTPAAGCDVYLLGGGEDTAQAYAVEWLAKHRDVMRAMSDSAVTFAVCAGMQVLGNSFTDARGRRHQGLGLLDVTTAPGPRRSVGELVSTCELPGVGLSDRVREPPRRHHPRRGRQTAGTRAERRRERGGRARPGRGGADRPGGRDLHARARARPQPRLGRPPPAPGDGPGADTRGHARCPRLGRLAPQLPGRGDGLGNAPPGVVAAHTTAWAVTPRLVLLALLAGAAVALLVLVGQGVRL